MNNSRSTTISEADKSGDETPTKTGWPATDFTPREDGRRRRLLWYYPVDFPGPFIGGFEGKLLLSEFYTSLETALESDPDAISSNNTAELLSKVMSSLVDIWVSLGLESTDKVVDFLGLEKVDENWILSANSETLLAAFESIARNRRTEIWDKYEYIASCQEYGPRKSHLDKGSLQHSVRALTRRWRRAAIDALDQFRDTCFSVSSDIASLYNSAPDGRVWLEWWTVRLLNWSVASKIPSFLVEEGYVPNLFSYFREWIEGFAWAAFQDIVSLRVQADRRTSQFADVYSIVNRGWFDWAKRIPRPEQRGSVTSFGRARDKVAETFGEELRRLGISKTQAGYLCGTLLTGASSAFLACTLGVPLAAGQEPPPGGWSYLWAEKDQLISQARADILRALSKDNGKKWGATPEDIAAACVKSLSAQMGEFELLVPPLPSNEFVVEFVSRLYAGAQPRSEDETTPSPSKLVLRDSYDTYCTFVHSYPFKRFLVPFASVLEVQVVAEELRRFVYEVVRPQLDLHKQTISAILGLPSQGGADS